MRQPWINKVFFFFFFFPALVWLDSLATILILSRESKA